MSDEYDVHLDGERRTRRGRYDRGGNEGAYRPGPAGGGRHRSEDADDQPGLPSWIADQPRPAGPINPGTARGSAAIPPAGLTSAPPPLPSEYGPPAPTPPGSYRSRNSRDSGPSVGGFVRGTIRVFGELMITCGLILLLFAAYEIYGKTAIVDAAQGDLDRAFDTPAAAARPGGTGSTGKPPPGGAVARLHIPRLAKKWVVVEGVAPKDIEVAPGHYPKSALPGQAGNFAIAGHRVKSTFWDLDDMVNGDPIVVETKTTWYVYKVARTKIVKPSAVEVVDPVPPGFAAGDKLVTITTCNPKWDNYERLIVHGALIRSQPRAAGDPPELRG
ncbi:class E sortase [Pilimelia anulata]|uniref:Class E sortase n=1 Tax=Pilimelia anulata TaxID=53371 RepID=A0A8J3F8F5_9ACTN|nr:class E sortase [Pilimelia anulata]GGJ88728.1 class E sortase [Pilimelia anulata]